MEVETVFLTCLRITGVHVETDGWTQRRTARGVKQRGTETKDGQRVSVAVWSVGSSVQVSWAGGCPGSVDLTHLGRWRENSAVTDFLA